MLKNIKAIQEVMMRRKQMVLLEDLPICNSDLMNTIGNTGYLKELPNETKKMVFAITVAQNMTFLGYTPEKDLMDKMLKDETVTDKVNTYIIPILKELSGDDKKYNPMYKNFPKEVMEKEDVELYFDAFVYALSGFQMMPASEEEKRKALAENAKLKKIAIGDAKDAKALLCNLLNSDVPFSKQDYEDIERLSKDFDIKNALPKKITNKENLALISALLYKESENRAATLESLKPYITSANDVLRIANVIYGDGNATLSDKIKIKTISRAERRALLSLINNCQNISEDMKLHQRAWIRFGEILHPGEYGSRFTKAYNSFCNMRENTLAKTVKTHNSRIEEIFLNQDIAKLTAFSKEKPGVIARNLDRLVREFDNPYKILLLWQDVSKDVAPTLLWKVHAHFKRRCEEYDDEAFRIFISKGKTNGKSTTMVVEDKTKKVDKIFYQNIIQITENALREIYKSKPKMGNVYISPEIKECKIPNGTRDASKGSISIAKGSKLSMNKNAKFIRPFVWWTNCESNPGKPIDIDLSTAFLNKDLEKVTECSFYNLKGPGYVHSGDMRTGNAFDGPGSSEFIDMDLEELKKRGIKYAAITVHVYNGFNFDKMEHIAFGWMEREDQMKGEIFEPSTVKQKIQLSAPSTFATACMLDLEKNQVIWMDEAGQDAFRYHYLNTLETTKQGMYMSCYKALHQETANIEDVIRINVEARGGTIVPEKENADIIFAFDEGITPADLDYFSGNLLPKVVAKEYLPEEDLAAEKNDETMKAEEIER